MKTNRLLALLFVLLFFSHSSFAQVGMGALKGKVVDKSNGEPIPFVSLKLIQNSIVENIGTTDFDGNYTIKPIAPGKYSLQVTYLGYQPIQINNIPINQDKITFYDINLLSAKIENDEFEFIEYMPPPKASGNFGRCDEVQKMPERNVFIPMPNASPAEPQKDIIRERKLP